MHRFIVGAALLAAPLIASVTPSRPDAASPGEAMELFAARWTADDSAGMHALLADTVVVLDRTPIQGSAAVTKWLDDQMAATGRLRMHEDLEHAVGYQATEAGQWSLELGELTEHGTHAFVLDRQSNGGWKIARILMVRDPMSTAK